MPGLGRAVEAGPPHATAGLSALAADCRAGASSRRMALASGTALGTVHGMPLHPSCRRSA
jgi:hypothetical protein